MTSNRLAEIKIEQPSYRLILNPRGKELILEDPKNSEILIHVKSLGLFLPDIDKESEFHVADNVEIVHRAYGSEKEIVLLATGLRQAKSVTFAGACRGKPDSGLFSASIDCEPIF